MTMQNKPMVMALALAAALLAGCGDKKPAEAPAAAPAPAAQAAVAALFATLDGARLPEPLLLQYFAAPVLEKLVRTLTRL